MVTPGSSAQETKVVVEAEYRKIVPICLHTEEVLVVIHGQPSDRVGTANLDLVALLDTSKNMSDDGKFDDMKKTAELVVEKMSKGDRLTLVSFSSEVEDISRHFHIGDEEDKKAAKEFIDKLSAPGHDANVKEGLSKAVEILGKHKKDGETEGLVAAIFVLSAGVQMANTEAMEVAGLQTLPVFTLGFGDDKDKLLRDIALKSHGGQYHPAQHVGDSLLQRHLETYLRDIRNDVSAVNLKVTLRPVAADDTTIVKVEPRRSYRVTNGQKRGEFIVEFGQLPRNKKREIVVGIQFPAVENEKKPQDIMAVVCSYDLSGDHPPYIITMERKRGELLHSPMMDSMASEMAHRDHAQRLGNVKNLAKNAINDSDKVWTEIKKARVKLEEMENKFIGNLCSAYTEELDHLEQLWSALKDDSNKHKTFVNVMEAKFAAHAR